MPRDAAPVADASWDTRLYPGLHLAAVAPEISDTLTQVLGVMGVEAEYFLARVRSFTAPRQTALDERASGDAFLAALDASALRLTATAQSLELATQAFLEALERSDASHGPFAGASRLAASPEAGGWWPPSTDELALGEPLELSLRRCGYAYRHVVAARLAPNVDAVAEHLLLVLHALSTLPPAGVVPVATLSAGLYELAATFQGHIVPHHLADLSPELPGLRSGIDLLLRLDAAEGASLDSDLVWARAQLADVQAVALQLAETSRPPAAAPRRGSLFGLLRRAFSPATAPLDPHSTQRWIQEAERDWRATITALEALGAAERRELVASRTR
jgi:hypothetical protein